MSEQHATRIDPVTRWGLLLGASVGLGTAIPLWIADIRLYGASEFPLGYAALPLLALLPLLGRIGRPVAGLRAYAASALVLAALAPAFVYAAVAMLEQPFLWSDRLDGAPDPVNRFLPAVLLGPMIAAPLLVRLVAAGSAWIDRAVGAAAVLATGFAMILLFAAAFAPPAVRGGHTLHEAWIVSGALGFGIALIALVPSFRRSAAQREIAAGRAGTLSEGGWIHFDDGRSSLRAPRGDLVPGPVIVLVSADQRGSIYRSGAALVGVEVLAGTRAQCLAQARAQVLSEQAFALAAALLTSAPLVGAALEGLIF